MDSSGEVTASADHFVVLFDGVCNLCNGAVQFVIKRDKHNKFLFASLQSAFAHQLLEKEKPGIDAFKSIVLIKNGKVFLRSDAALEITKHLSGLWPALYVLKIFPRFVRDGFYNLIAKYRYILFGKRDVCMIPDPKLKAKFIE